VLGSTRYSFPARSIHPVALRPSRTSEGLAALRLIAVKRINCVCGSVVEGDDDDELWEKALQHLRDDHPDLAGKVAREDIVAQAEEI
jgi:predicted small metal-binding protein